MSVENVLDSFNQAMEIHVQKAIESLDYNKTELCEITDITERDKGWYTVYNGSAKYRAFSENTQYEQGMKVYVNIPNNDFTAQKTILGQYKREGEEAVFYVSPLKRYDALSPDLAFGTGTHSILANGNAVKKQVMQSEPLFDKPQYNGYKYMGVSAYFMTKLKQCISGRYGLRFIVEYTSRPETTGATVKGTKTFLLDTSTMIGALYNFSTYYRQEALFDISDIQTLNRITVELFQDGDFKDNNNVLISSEYNGNKLPDNIFMQDLSIKFGNDITDTKDSLNLYTLNGLTYNSAQSDALNRKNLEIRWAHKNQESGALEEITSLSQLSKYKDIDRATAHIHWYRDTLYTSDQYKAKIDAETQANEDLINLIENWKQNPSNQSLIIDIIQSLNLEENRDYQINNGVYSFTTTGSSKITNKQSRIAKSSSKTASNNLAGEFWEEILDAQDRFSLKNFLPDNIRQNCKVKVIIVYNDTTVYSNELVFENLVDLNASDLDNAIGLSILTLDNSGGHYPIYSSDTHYMLNRTDVSKQRRLRAEYKSVKTNESYFNGNEQIVWKIPTVNTMIELIPKFYEGAQILTNDTDIRSFDTSGDTSSNFIYISRAVSNSAQPVAQEQTYKIRQYYAKSFVNNTITCFVLKNNTVAKAHITLDFSEHGASGTDFTFNLSLGNLVDANFNIVGGAEPALTIGEQYWHEIDMHLYDSENNEVNIDDKKNGIITAWINHTSNGYYSGSTNAASLNFIRSGNRVAVKIRPDINNMDNLDYIVLKATISTTVPNLGNTVSFTQFLPLHIRKYANDYLVGPDYIIYDDKGGSPKVALDPYSIAGKSTTARVITPDATRKNTAYPTISENRLVPVAMYLDTNSTDVAVRINGGNEDIYSVPIVIIKNRYQVPALNEWNGNLLVDAGKNRVLAAMVGAGHKNSDNTFTGVVMGDVQKDTEKVSGLFGYNAGAQVFSLDTKGELVLGKSGLGQITMNGNKGVIQSGNFVSRTSGMKIDLQNGSIDAAHFRIDSAGNAYFDGEIYTGKGKMGGWIINPAEITSESGKAHIYANGSLNFNNKFIVDTDGNLTAQDASLSNASVSGHIEASSGNIGNWYIRNFGLEYTGQGRATFAIRYDGTIGIQESVWMITSGGYGYFTGLSVGGQDLATILTDYDTRLTTNKNAIAVNASGISGLKTELGALSKTVAGLNNAHNQLASRVANDYATKSELSGYATKSYVDGKVSGYASSSSVSSLESRVAALESRGGGLFG